MVTRMMVLCWLLVVGYKTQSPNTVLFCALDEAASGAGSAACGAVTSDFGVTTWGTRTEGKDHVSSSGPRGEDIHIVRVDKGLTEPVMSRILREDVSCSAHMNVSRADDRIFVKSMGWCRLLGGVHNRSGFAWMTFPVVRIVTRQARFQ